MRQLRAMAGVLFVLAFSACRMEQGGDDDIGYADMASAPSVDSAPADSSIVAADLAAGQLCSILLGRITQALENRQCAADEDCTCVCLSSYTCFRGTAQGLSLAINELRSVGCAVPPSLMPGICLDLRRPACRTGLCTSVPIMIN